MVYSFDVFDTLITRKTATPQGVYAYMSKELRENELYSEMDPYIVENFYELRIRTEKAARSFFCKEDVEDVNLEQIYQIMGRTSCLSQKEQEKLVNLEREAEYELSVGVEKNISYFKDLYQEGHHLILISDMYLDTETIRRMLMKADPVFEKIPLYVSSAFCLNKASGKLFQFVMDKEKIRPEEWVHVGDHPRSDQEVPESLGIRIQAVPQRTLLQCEQAAIKEHMHDFMFQLPIGASVNARFFSENKSIAYQYGTSLGGNLVHSYVCWLLRRSLKMGIQRLYFIARDAWLLKEIADSVIEQERYDIQTFYIYGSRKAWRLAGLTERYFELALLVRWDVVRKNASWKRLSEVLEVDISELAEFLEDEDKDVEKQYAESEFLKKIQILEQNKEFQQFLLKRYADKQRTTITYLRQNVDVSDENYAFVELIGSGYTQRALSNLMEDFSSYPVRTFFYHLDAYLDTERCQFFCYQPDKVEKSGLIELFYTAPHGHTIGYHVKEDGIAEVVLDSENEALIRYGLWDYIDGVRKFARICNDYACYLGKEKMHADLPLFYRRYLACADEDLMTYMCDMPYKSSGREKEILEYAPHLDEEMMRLLAVPGGMQKVRKNYRGSDLEFSKKRMDENVCEYWRRIHGFPVKRLEKKLVLYGAGKFGQALYEAIKKDQTKEIVLWVDRNYNQFYNGLVSPTEKIQSVEYDQLIVAILNEKVATQVKKNLIKQGTPEEKIITYEWALKSDMYD